MKLEAETWKVVLAVVLVQIIVIAWIIVFWQYRAYLQARTLSELTIALHNAELKTYERQAAGDFGGAIPKDTLNMYIAAVERGDYRVASTYFVRDMRQDELRRFVGADIVSIREFTALLKQASLSVNSARPEGKIFRNAVPIAFVMRQAENGVWQFESIDYQPTKSL